MGRQLRKFLYDLPKLILATVLAGLITIILNRSIHIEFVTTRMETPDLTTRHISTKFCNTDITTTQMTSAVTVNTTLKVNSTDTPSIDYNTISNPHPYKYTYQPVGVCKSTGNTADPLLLILVKSNVFQIGHRMAIRSTWGNFTHNNTIQIAFLLGYSSLITPFALMEYDMYKDIIQENFMDEYKNNTLKTIMGFNWAVKYCNQAKFVLFVDDDYYVNIPFLLHYIQNIILSEDDSTFVGYRYQNARVRRKKDSKWYVPVEEYPNKYWPPYISGGSMLLSMEVVRNMTKAFPHVKQIFIDDVYLGIVAELLNISLTHDRRFEVKYVPDKLDTLFTSHDFGSPNRLVQEWNEEDEEAEIKIDK